MEPISLAFAALNFTGSLVAEQIAGEAFKDVWSLVKQTIWRRFGRDPNPSDLKSTSEIARDLDPALISSAEALFSSDPTLRRVRLVAKVFERSRILWVDDMPKGNTYEAGFLRELGSQVDQVFTTEEGIARVNSEEYDLVISDMERAGDGKAGLTLLQDLRPSVPLVFYIMKPDPKKDRPRGSLGVVCRPDDLFHLIMDALERTRS